MLLGAGGHDSTAHRYEEVLVRRLGVKVEVGK
jgi:hypothetical protein